MNHNFITAKSFFSQDNRPVFLYKNIWKEQTTALLHGPREIDKSELALAIATDIASRGKDVLYVNTTGNIEGLKSDSERVFIFKPEFESIDDKSDYADLVFDAIEYAVRNTAIRTFVIDSVNRIAALSFGRNASQAYIMKRLVALQVKCKLSILVLADHTTKSVKNALIALSDIDMGLSIEPAEMPKSETHTTTGSVRRYVIAEDSEHQLSRGVKSDAFRFPVCRPAAR